MAINYPANSRIRAYGRARIEIAQKAKTNQDWAQLWKPPAHPFPFIWGERWKQSLEYKVDDFPAEIGFYIDILGLPVNAFDPDYAMFTSPRGDFYITVVPATEDNESTPPDSFRIQFMIEDILETTTELEQRGITFEQSPQPCQPGSSLYIGYFRTPHGICIDLWGVVTENAESSDGMDESLEDEEFEEEDNLHYDTPIKLPSAQEEDTDDWDDDEDEEDEWEGDEEEKGKEYIPTRVLAAKPPEQQPYIPSLAQRRVAPSAPTTQPPTNWPIAHQTPLARAKPAIPGNNGGSQQPAPPKPHDKPPEPEYVDDE
ncbi:MAG: VOC family protein [Anaerolineales bacterium]|nr:VOC family protein [Anaerolineales bacterium]